MQFHIQRRLERIHNLYTSSNTRYQKLDIRHKKFQEFYISFLKFKSRLGDLHKESYWLDYIRTLSRYRFRCAVSPLPFNHISNISGLDNYDDLKKKTRDCDEFFPEFKTHSNNLLELYRDLSESEINPFNEKLEEILKKFYQKNCALILKSQSSYEFISKLFDNNKYLSILKETEYRKSSNSYDLVIFLGHHSWYKHYLFTSIKSKNLIGICYDFIGGKKIEPLEFSHPLWERNITSIKHEEQNLNFDKYIFDSPEETANDIEIEYIQKNIDKKYGDTSEEQLNARLVNLAGNYIAFLRNHQGIDTTQDVLKFSPDISFKSTEVTEIETGDYILLRTGADRDLIFTEANKLMGQNSKIYRKLQIEWKHRLKDYILNNGWENGSLHNREYQEKITLMKLKNKGVNINLSKLRRWANDEKLIKPNNDNDFILILKELFPNEKNINKYSNAMSIIYNKHISAGSIVRKKILNQIQNSDLLSLEQNGFQEFKIPDTKASISVFKVLKISTQDKLQWRSQTDTPILASDILDD